MSKVSIIVPVYNNETTITQCLESILNQTFTDYDVIIVIDGSTDNSIKIAKQFADKDSRISIVTQQNQGLGSARNTGIKHSNSPYVAFLDSDDCYKPKMLEIMMSKIDSTKADIANCEVNNLIGKNLVSSTKLPPYKLPASINLISGKEAAALCLNGVVPEALNPAWNKIIKRDLFVKNNIWFPEQFRYVEDIPTSIPLLLMAEKVVFVHQPLYEYIHYENSLTTSKATIKKADDLVENVRDILNFVSTRGIKISVNNFVISTIFPIEKNITRASKEDKKQNTEQIKRINQMVQQWRTNFKPNYKIKDLPTIQKIKLFVSYHGFSSGFSNLLDAFKWLPFIKYLT